MIYLGLSILCSTLILILFRSFKSFGINTKHAIVFNYLTACTYGILSYDGKISVSTTLRSDWLYGAIVLGVLFITIFNVMARTTQENGLSVASVASKMSVVIPVVFAIFVYKEAFSIIKVISILIALFAVYFTSIKKNEKLNLKKSLYLPILLFLGSGCIDTSLKYIETTHVPVDGIPLFSSTIFGIAGILGIIWLFSIKETKEGNLNFLKSISAGFVLGIVNYNSVYFLLKALQNETLDSSTVFVINNVAIVSIASLIGFVIFKESITKLNLLGILLALVAILLLSL